MIEESTFVSLCWLGKDGAKAKHPNLLLQKAISLWVIIMFSSIKKYKEEIKTLVAQGMEEDEAKKLVQDALMKLPYKMRVVLSLKEYANLSYKQIGEILKISEGNVKIRVFRARQKLSEILDKGDVYVP